jgi:predicted negative regulator of RcsB-dependent stress response
MTKKMARERRPEHIDTEDHVTERILEAAAWAEAHRRAVVAAGIVLVLVVAASFYYKDYRSKLEERASVRFQELQISTQSADAETIRSELRIFIDQYASTPYADQARVALGQLELRRDSLTLAVQALEPVAEQGEANPLAYAAMKMIATAYEQGGDLDRAGRWYDRIASDARFDYQRRMAMAEKARLYTVSGRYAEAASLYEQLISEIGDDPANQAVYAVRLGEVRTLERFGAAPPTSVPTVESSGMAEESSAPAAADSANDGTGDNGSG